MERLESNFAFTPESYTQGTSREWLVANGLGGYASSTVVGANTRAYHGLLVAAMSPPVERIMLLSSLDEELYLGEDHYQLACHQYPGVIHPQGYRYMKEFRLDPLPHFSFRAGGMKVDKTVLAVHGENTAIIMYKVSGPEGKLKITPLTSSRSFHAASNLPSISSELVENGVRLQSSYKLFLLSDKARFVQKELVYNNFEYQEERLRGLPWRENLFSPGYFEIDFGDEAQFSIIASTERKSMPVATRLMKKELDRLSGLEASFKTRINSHASRLAQAADSFIVKRDKGKSIIAGYHWFDDWGRDAMISLPGLLLVSGRFDEAKAVLETFALAMKDGVLPNDLGAKSYNTVDASLWFLQAVSSYFSYTEDKDFLARVWPRLEDIVEHYSDKSPLVMMDSDGLLITGPALTWMDARVDGKPIVPRNGKACEINALWYSNLKIMEQLAWALDQPWDNSKAMQVKDSYQKFWNPESGCLFDVIGPEDGSVRPNQVIAAAIPDLLSVVKRKSILDVVTHELLTPYGLRTLSPRDPRYVGRYDGDPGKRDGAYHQGTVWPWLIGPYIRALVSIGGESEEIRKQAGVILKPLMDLNLMGINTIPEVFDGDAPQRPGGCISQAWSVAEVIRAWYEDVLGKSGMR